MSAVYRIDVEHHPGEPIYKWSSKVFRLSDESYMSGSAQAGETENEAVLKAHVLIRSLTDQREPYSIFTDESGMSVDSPVTAVAS